jgi:hypothetical protein
MAAKTCHAVRLAEAERREERKRRRPFPSISNIGPSSLTVGQAVQLLSVPVMNQHRKDDRQLIRMDAATYQLFQERR